MHWYKRDPHRALDGMFILTLEERGAYNTVLDLIYARDGQVLDDDHFIAGWCRVDVRVWRRIKTRLIELQKLHVEHGSLRNLRATSEIDEALCRALSVSELNSIKGKKSGIARRKINSLGEPTVEPNRTHLQPDSQPQQDKNKEAPRANAHRGAHLIPEEWKPKEKHTQLASQLGLSTEQMEAFACQMQDWSKGSGKKRTDWDATFNNWIRREAQRLYKPNGKHEPPPRKYKTYRPPGWTEDDERQLEKTSTRHATETSSLLAQGEGIPDKDWH